MNRSRGGVESAIVAGAFTAAVLFGYLVGAPPAVHVAIATVVIVTLPLRRRSSTSADQLSQIAIAQGLVPGLMLAAALSLALPVAAFRHGAWVLLEMVTPLVVGGVWLAGAAAASAFAERRYSALPPSAMRAWSRAAVVAAAAALAAFALLRGGRRVDPDGYWGSLAPLQVVPRDRWRETHPGKGGGRATAGTARDPCENGPDEQCQYVVDDRSCLGMPHSAELDFVVDAHPRTWCPYVELRREPNGKRRALLRGSDESNVGDAPRGYLVVQWRQGPELTAIAVGDAISAPTLWIASSVGAQAVALFAMFVRYLRRRRGQQRAEFYAAAASARGEPLVDWDDVLFWRHTVLLLVAGSAPLATSLMLGVGD